MKGRGRVKGRTLERRSRGERRRGEAQGGGGEGGGGGGGKEGEREEGGGGVLQAAVMSTTSFPHFPLFPPTVHANAPQHMQNVFAAAAQVSAARGQEAGFYHLLQQPPLPPPTLLPGMGLPSSLPLSLGLSGMAGSMAAAGGGGGGRGEGGGGGGGGGGGMLAAVAGGGIGGGVGEGAASGSGGHRCGRCGHLKKAWPGLHSDGKNGREPCTVTMEGVELPKLRRAREDEGKCVHPGCTTCLFHI